MEWASKHLRRFTPVIAAWIVLVLRYLAFVVYEMYVRAGGGGGFLPAPTLSPWNRLLAEVGLWAMFSLFVGMAVRLVVDRKSIGTGTDIAPLETKRKASQPVDDREAWEWRRYCGERFGTGIVLLALLVFCFMDVVAPQLGLLVLGYLALLPILIVTAYLLVLFVFRLLVGDAKEKSTS